MGRDEHFFRAPFLAPSSAERGEQCLPKQGCSVTPGVAEFALSSQTCNAKTTTTCTHAPGAAYMQVSDKARLASRRTSLPQPVAIGLSVLGVHISEAVNCAGYIKVRKRTRIRRRTHSSSPFPVQWNSDPLRLEKRSDDVSGRR